MSKFHIYIRVVFVAALLFAGCSDESGPVMIALKFRPGQLFISESVRNSDFRKYIEDSLIESYPCTEYVQFTEKTLDTLPGGKGLLQWTTEMSRLQPDSLDSKVTDTVRWSMTINTVQHADGYNEFYSIADSSRLSLIDYYKRYLEQMSLILPDEPVGVGYEWDHTFKVILKNGEIKDASNHYKITGFEKKMGYDCAVIDRDAVLILPLQYVTQDSSATLIQLTHVKFKSRTYLAYKESAIVHEQSDFDEKTEGTWYEPGKISHFRTESKGTSVSKMTKLTNP